MDIVPSAAPLPTPARDTAGEHEDTRIALLAKLTRHLAEMQARAPSLDADAHFPAQDVSLLHACGALLAPFPEAFGGLGLGTEPAAAECLQDVLFLLGRAHVAIGRLYEAHVNAVRLLTLYGVPGQIQRAAADAGSGRMIGLWVTDTPGTPLRAAGNGELEGGKSFCSGAGHVASCLVTCLHPDGSTRLAYLSTAGTTATPLPASLQGVRAARTGQVAFGGTSITAADWIGQPGDYLREPDFSAGAWRTSAVTAGCLARLVDLAIEHLAARHRAANPHQQTRLGKAWIARETARFWTTAAARAAEGVDPADPQSIIATVNFARIAIEAAAVETLNLVERSIGLQAFLVGTDIERVRRDLSTYLRQPAPDEVLCEAAAHIVQLRQPSS